MEKGSLSIHSENIFPIIKKWLYSDLDIFVRELVSNGCDAMTKLKKLTSLGEITLSEAADYRVDVTVSEKDGTITFSDRGIGMTEEEVKKYINQIAFSGAYDFLENTKTRTRVSKSSAISDWAFIPLLWWLMKLKFRHSPARTALHLSNGPATAARNMKWRKGAGSGTAPISF